MPISFRGIECKVKYQKATARKGPGSNQGRELRRSHRNANGIGAGGRAAPAPLTFSSKHFRFPKGIFNLLCLRDGLDARLRLLYNVCRGEVLPGGCHQASGFLRLSISFRASKERRVGVFKAMAENGTGPRGRQCPGSILATFAMMSLTRLSSLSGLLFCLVSLAFSTCAQ